MKTARCLVLFFLFGASTAEFDADYVPKSFYVIDQSGRKSDVVYVRSKRDLMPLLARVRRGGGYASATSHASSSAGAGAGGGGGGGAGGAGGAPFDFGGDFTRGIVDPDQFAANFPAGFFSGNGKGGASSFASSSSSGNGYGSGYGGSGGSGGAGGHVNGIGGGAGGPGPQLFSRFGEGQGTGVHVAGHAEGPRGAFSQSSSSIDGTGKIKYSVQSGKY